MEKLLREFLTKLAKNYLKQPVENQRYFLISYAHANGFGEFGMQSTTYPKRTDIRNLNVTNVQQLVTLNIVEVSKEDYIVFNGLENNYKEARQAPSLYIPCTQ
jgi:hypothetical protein